jgi:hypothetical protein
MVLKNDYLRGSSAASCNDFEGNCRGRGGFPVSQDPV